MDNLIYIKHGSLAEIEKALRQWITLYYKDLKKKQTFELGRINHDSILLKADGLDNDRFFYLINYLKYPEDIDYQIDIEGFTTAQKYQDLIDKKLFVYIPSNDNEYDNVFVVTPDNEKFKIDFSGQVKPVSDEKIYKLPDVIACKEFKTIRVDKQKIGKIKDEKERIAIQKRFIVLTIITVLSLLFCLGCYITRFSHANEIALLFGIGIGVWFYMDYKMLRIDRFYLYSFLIALGFVCFGIWANINFVLVNSAFIKSGPFIPMSLLIVQKPLRYIFKFFIKREPVVNQNEATFWDRIYSGLLIFLMYILPIIFFKYS